MFKLNSDNPTQVTETQVLVYGAERPAEIVDRLMGGRLIVANPGKANAWLILDNAVPPTALMKSLKGLAVQADMRIVVRRKERPEALDEAIAKVESFMTDGSAEKAAKREAAAQKAAATRAAERTAKAEVQREAARKARADALAAERARPYEAARPAREAAAAARAAERAEEQRRRAHARAHRTVFCVADAPRIGEKFTVKSDGRESFAIADSYGSAWTDGNGDRVCYVYWHYATAADVDAPWYSVRTGQIHQPVVTLPVEQAPAVGETLRMRSGTVGTVTALRNRRFLDSGSENVTSFYSSELWDCTVVDVEYSTEGGQP